VSCVGVPLQRGGLVDRLLFEGISRFVRFEHVERNSRLGLVLPLVVERQMQYCVGHGPFVDVLEVLEDHGEHLVVKVAVVAEVAEDLPGLHHFAYLGQVVEVRPTLDQRQRRIFGRWVLAK
jgi:hypothetical protein